MVINIPLQLLQSEAMSSTPLSKICTTIAICCTLRILWYAVMTCFGFSSIFKLLVTSCRVLNTQYAIRISPKYFKAQKCKCNIFRRLRLSLTEKLPVRWPVQWPVAKWRRILIVNSCSMLLNEPEAILII